MCGCGYNQVNRVFYRMTTKSRYLKNDSHMVLSPSSASASEDRAINCVIFELLLIYCL
ncbi:hypothetical protein NVIE_0607 [Nitrososphaera viennensis EN76]|uniref:Uncharacterized protein n=1 Tax=Nitrososphaera viennensis EN76 TaxID=926571 RepID=A0A060HDL0_9ARCH|nr:hypothetical protein NVIE_0607 [Nitrososphaera viennensis EN76]